MVWSKKFKIVPFQASTPPSSMIWIHLNAEYSLLYPRGWCWLALYGGGFAILERNLLGWTVGVKMWEQCRPGRIIGVICNDFSFGAFKFSVLMYVVPVVSSIFFVRALDECFGGLTAYPIPTPSEGWKIFFCFVFEYVLSLLPRQCSLDNVS